MTQLLILRRNMTRLIFNFIFSMDSIVVIYIWLLQASEAYQVCNMTAIEFNQATEVATRNVAVIFGVTGLVGRELLRRLLSKIKWKVYGIARRFDSFPVHDPNYHFISCDLLNAQETQKKLSVVQDVSHVFWITWAGQFPLESRECCEQNLFMMSNALNAVLSRTKTLKHVSLQTGMKHYVSVQRTQNAKQEDGFYDEYCPRATEGHNFYHVLEDLLKERLASKVAWSVLRPGLVMGSSNRTLYNVMGCLSVYGAICKYLNLPFVFGGTREVWEEVCLDGSDASLVAELHIWAATNDEISSPEGQAFNAVNGSSFTWKEIWPVLGKMFDVEVPEDVFSEDFRFATAMNDKSEVWREITRKEVLVETEMEDLANWEFLDALFRCPVKMLGSRKKADQLGFTMRCKTVESILHWIDSMRNDKLIP